MSHFKIRAEYRLACLAMELAYGLTAFFRQTRFRGMMNAHRLRLRLVG
ncbi:hypothetical protein [Asticcacaulis sp. 201]|nr:hypothetical protein [Asticcacaulis sp. 201]MDV6332392.1 hypothetical protein [Asticcacaulis sp. 201]